MQTRIDNLRGIIAEAGVDGLLITGSTNRRYMSGFTGSAGALFISGHEALLLTDFRYTDQAAQEASAYEVVIYNDLYTTLGELLAGRSGSRIGFEADRVTVSQMAQLEKAVAGPAGGTVEWVATRDLVERLRGIKSVDELVKLQKAIDIADECFEFIVGKMSPGVTEREIAWQMEVFMRERGASALSFPSIVASGVNGALPHARPSDKPLAAGEFVTLDFGCIWEGYCSDMTRTVFIGEPTDRDRELYDLVLKAQVAGVDAVRPGVAAKDVDKVARDIIRDAGYGEAFGHGLGHGIGMDVHEEFPRLSPRGEVVLAPGMVASVEPGVYLSDWGGIRIEDLVVVTEDGARVLTNSPKHLMSLPA